MLKQGKSNKLLAFLLLAVVFAAGYFYSSYRSSTRVNVSGTDPFAPNVSSLPKTKEEKYDRLKKLSPEVQISYFSDLLGKSVYINYFDNKTRGYEFLKDEIREYIFVDTDYYVQAITDRHDRVMSFAVTSRKEDFNPTFSVSPEGEISLNKSPFSKWLGRVSESQPLLCYRFAGAHDPFLYFEQAYFGNPGHYLTYLVGINNSAPLHEWIPAIKDGYDFSFSSRIQCDAINEEDRVRMSPNTYIVRGMSFIDVHEATENSPGIFFGPENVLVRTLNEQ